MTPLSLLIKQPTLLTEALTHRSYLNEHPRVTRHNERLEFLGDAVLELGVSQFLYDKFPQKKEGDLTTLRAALVRTSTLAEVALNLNLGTQLRLSKGEEVTGGRTNPSLLANTLEAVIGALYLDQGYTAVVDFLSQHLFPKIDVIIDQKLFKDYKSHLQETVQAKGSASPSYTVVATSGPDHDKIFTVAVIIDGREVATGQGKSKQLAQQAAARHALEKWPTA
ncbi:ribonuclease III [Microgenomates group bacterium RBG_16_45_19]|nr:MAG: ribonuclease III [Microgenomates group bacterium RBG_16_45_19]